VIYSPASSVRARPPILADRPSHFRQGSEADQVRILMLAHRIPYPPHTGDKTRAFHIARHLARHHDLTLAFLVDERADLNGIAPLGDVVGEIEFARLWKPWSLVKGVAGLAAGGALSVPYFRSHRLDRRLGRRAAAQPYDLVYASSTPMAQYARTFGCPVVMDFVDVDSDKWRQYSDHHRPPLSWLYRTEGRRLQAAEADTAQWAGLCLLATAAEETLLQSFAPWARTAVIPNGIDLAYYTPVSTVPGHPAVLFTGAMDYLPNVDAVTHFCADILPRVRWEIPDTQFYIVGLKPSAAVLRLAKIPGVTVTGAVADVRPYYARASVCVAPLRIGRGVQNKVLQGMAMGLPVVASTLAGRGIGAEPSRHLEIADEPAEFAGRVVRLLKSPGDRRALGCGGRAFVEANYAWERALIRLEALLHELIAARKEPRSRPEQGVPLSTRYPGGRSR
jgi:sugar transferase (PEP-CTERM/EpsH1 system associated)